MTMSTRVRDPVSRRSRAERVLDAAGELLLRLGYRRVTIDDVAARAGIGKGTVYLHWSSREALFRAVLLRESAVLTDEMLDALRADPALVLPHALVRLQFTIVMRRPLLRAMFVSDLETLGSLARAFDPQLQAARQRAFDDYLRLLREHGLIRTDLSIAELGYAVRAAVLGFYLGEPLSQTASPPDLTAERKAELLATTVERAFAPAGPPDAEAVRAVAPAVIAAFEEVNEAMRAAALPGLEA
jgi:AcrR family transcriptional regulator